MYNKNINDFELIYLIQTGNDTIAFEYLCKKYDKLIWKYINMYDIPYHEFDDFHQEGLIVLYKAAKTFDEQRNKTFTRYFELILKRRFWHLISKVPKTLELEEEITGYNNSINYEEIETKLDLKYKFKSEIEQVIFDKYYIDSMSVAEINKQFKYGIKQIYNAIYRVKIKLTKKIKKEIKNNKLLK